MWNSYDLQFCYVDLLNMYLLLKLCEFKSLLYLPLQYYFGGRYDLVKFCKIVHQAGMYLILRIGPFVAAEWNFGYACHLHGLAKFALFGLVIYRTQPLCIQSIHFLPHFSSKSYELYSFWHLKSGSSCGGSMLIDRYSTLFSDVWFLIKI